MKVKRAAFLALGTLAGVGAAVAATAASALPYLVWAGDVADINFALMICVTGLLVTIFGAIFAGLVHSAIS